MKYFRLLLILLFTNGALGQKIHHQVAMPHPETHYFHIKTVLTNFKDDTLILTMPVWAPGSYKIREFPKNVNQVKAIDGDGTVIPIQKISKNKWQIVKGKAKKVVVKYKSYAYEVSVRTAYLDKTHGFLNGGNVFTFPIGYRNLGGTLTVIPYKDFKKITVPLPSTSDGVAKDNGAKTYIFENFDQLADSPMEFGNQTTFSFKASGVTHHVAIYGPGNYSVEQLKSSMTNIINAETAIWKQNPNKEYWFIIHNVVHPTGGLEHARSTTLSVDRWGYTPNKISDFLETMAHEYFHLWNVKRLRPKNLVRYNYSKENYTNLLWFSEGFTSYYALVALHRAGIYTTNEFIGKYNSKLNWILSLPGNRVQPVANASFDAWIKAYRPNENSKNTTISYYSKGAVIAGVFDASIIQATNGKKSLDDFMRLLYKKYYKENNTGVTLQIIKNELEKMTNKSWDSFFTQCIEGTQPIPFKEFFSPLGIQVNKKTTQYISMGMSLRQVGGKVIISNLRAGSAAIKAGLSPNDEIIAFNGIRVNRSLLSTFLNDLDPGDSFKLLISHANKITEIEAKMGIVTKTSYSFHYDGGNKSGDYWLRSAE